MTTVVFRSVPAPTGFAVKMPQLIRVGAKVQACYIHRQVELETVPRPETVPLDGLENRWVLDIRIRGTSGDLRVFESLE